MILHPEYVVGRIGLVCGQEDTNREAIARWLIKLDSENMVVSLTVDEFQVINQKIK